MKINPTKDVNFHALTSRQQADIILNIMREKAGATGRLECPDGFRLWLQAELVEHGYKVRPKFIEYSYSNAFSLLKSLGLVISLNKPHTSKPAIYKVDPSSTIDEAKAFKSKLNSYFLPDLRQAFERVDGNPKNRIYYEVRIAHQEIDLEEKDRIIAKLSELLNNVNNSLQEANKFVKDAQKRRKQA